VRSDHLETDVGLLNLTDTQLHWLRETMDSPHISTNATLRERAAASLVNVSAHFAYRYMQSSEWAGHYHGRKINESIIDTVEWRYHYDFANLDTSVFSSLIQKGLTHVSPVLDKKGRSIIYVRGSHDGKRESPESYLRLLMYSVERADRMSVEGPGQGEFVTMINLANFSPFKVPPSSAMREGIALLKKHYPYRLAAVFIVNAGAAFDMLWRVFKPLIPARALRKTFFLTSKELSEGLILEREMGREFVDQDFGGTAPRQLLASEEQVAAYLASGFWEKEKEKEKRTVPVSP